MDHKNGCEHTNCTGASANASVCQTLSEMDWERGLWYAAFNGDMDRVTMLIDKARNARVAVNAPDNSGYTPLHYSARKGYEEICNIFIQNGAQVDATTKSGKATPLHKAAAAGHVKTVKLLIKSGASVNFKDVDGQTALHKAIQYNHFDLIDILVEACPDLESIKDIKGRIAADYIPNPKD